MSPPKRLGLCEVPGCGKAAKGRGYCNPHYQLWYRHGKPEAPKIDRTAQLLAQLHGSIFRDGVTDCWLWAGKVWSFGHGVISVKGKHKKAHRVMWEVTYGSVPEGLCVCHRCDVPCCVNPSHLFLGTQEDNIRDRDSKGRQAHGERSGTAKLTAKEVIAIRESAEHQNDLARLYGVTPQAINAIRKNKVWRHLLAKQEQAA